VEGRKHSPLTPSSASIQVGYACESAGVVADDLAVVAVVIFAIDLDEHDTADVVVVHLVEQRLERLEPLLRRVRVTVGDVHVAYWPLRRTAD
jgi:hypothetical protein